MVTPSCDRMKPSRDVCTPRALPDQGMTRYFPTSTNAQRDRGYLHSEIAANSVQGSSTVTGSYEGEGGAWRLLIFRLSPDGRISHVKTAPPRLGRPIENKRTAMVRICRPGLRHPFLPRRR